ncbi:acid phosphatase/vanadium-dependent haloperoxidase [Anopheles sinensis]|uniref:Acid phosphatase/vanadium-dependent haloperoxidase n=1 Tax=Anopheles sinensis TaxID=74873 RepID=A0A084WBU5_ANOSI|nr:acid phosphatase/vanadium-dependent haloperoxidase [Anopheles sinensis]
MENAIPLGSGQSKTGIKRPTSEDAPDTFDPLSPHLPRGREHKLSGGKRRGEKLEENDDKKGLIEKRVN